MNLKLIRASTYISQFNIVIKHKAGRDHVIPDALSRLPARRPSHEPTTTETQAYNGTIVELSEPFKARLLEAYKEREWATIWAELEQENPRVPTKPTKKTGRATRNRPTTPQQLVAKEKNHRTSFQMHGQLIFHVNSNTGKQRLCIPKSMMGEVFKIAHDNAFHMGYHRAFNTLSEGLYIRRLAHHLKQYIDCCPECRFNRTARHAPYGSMVAITSPAVPFHTICMDFIVALPPSGPRSFNSILTITDKFSKGKILIPGRDDMTAKDWATQLLNYLRLCNWGMPRATISDRDPKFRSELWKELFKLLKIDLLVSTAYHPQTDGLSERTNQTVEIALRYLISSNPTIAWHESLPALQSSLMNSRTMTTGMTPNEILYGYSTRDGLGLLDPHNSRIAREDQRTLFRAEASDAIDFANARAKIRYDKTHSNLNFEVGDRVYLRLHHGYTLPEMPNKKLSNQRVGPFEITEKIGRLAYKLNLPPTMKIHPVVSISQLEPAEKADPYHRKRPDHPGPVEMEETDLSKSKDTYKEQQRGEIYEVKRIVGKRLRKYGRSKPRTEYRVKWIGWGPEWNQWIGEDDCARATELIKEFEISQATA